MDNAPKGRVIKGPPAKMISGVSDSGYKLWDELHLWALSKNPTSGFLANFRERIACGNCLIKWDAWVAKNPPNFTNLFNWSVDAHNVVNKELGKRIFSYEEAYDYYAILAGRRRL